MNSSVQRKSDITTQDCCTWKDELAILRSDVAACLETKSVFLKWEEVSMILFSFRLSSFYEILKESSFC